jgi:hypothetical protein
LLGRNQSAALGRFGAAALEPRLDAGMTAYTPAIRRSGIADALAAEPAGRISSSTP